MDSRAKQRLTGAVILVALFVLLVPELLTGPKEGAVAPAAEEEGLRKYTIDLGAPPATSAQQAESAVQFPAAGATTPAAGGDGALAQPGEAAQPEPTQPEPAQPQTASPAVAQTPAPTPAQSQAPAASPAPASASPPATVVPRTETNTRDKPPATPASANGRFVVQLGSFSSRDNAERLVRDMTAKGFATFIAPITTNGRTLYRVRVGPAKDRPSAEALAAQLKRMGQSGAIVPIS